MHVLRWTFKLFIASGYFLPPTLKSPTKRFLYNLYTVFVTLYMWSYSLTLIMYICYNVETQDDLSENFGITVTALITSCKLMSLVIGRKTIINMLDLLKKKPFVPENNGEVAIHAKYDNLIEKVAMFYTIQAAFCALALVGTTLVSDFKLKKLMFRAWFPFDFTSSWFAFSITFIYQFVGLVIIAIGVSMFDTFFAGLLLQICCQFEILVNRLHNIGGDEIQSLKHCVWHHNKIFRFAEIVNNFFNKMMFVQFMVSAVAICFTLYQLTEANDSLQIIGWISFMFSALIQTFYFCWFGDAAKVKSLDISNMVYNSDWPNLSNDARKMLVIIMARSLTPVEITSAYILPMNLESFKGVSIYIEIHYLYKRRLKTILGKLSNSPSIWEKTILPILYNFCITLIRLTLQFSRVLLSIAGCLPPSSWTSPFTKSLYKFYTLFVWLLILSLVSAQILDIIINVENQDQFSDNFYITLVVFVSGCKLSIMLKHRESILSLIESLEREPFSPMNHEEEKIQMKFNKTNERIAICYTILVEVAAIWIFVRAFLTDFKKRKLIFRAWLPYDYSELLPYTFTYTYEVATSLLCSCQNVASDTLFAGLLIQINGQFEILEERLRNIEEDSNYSAKQCVKHYQQIYKFSKTVNEKFKIILFLQFCTIAFTLCFNLYRMTNITMLSKFLEASLFLIRIIAQILYYCWFSNEVKLKSLQVPAMIFKSNWASWDTKTKKILLVIMTRATHPIEFTSGYLVTLNIDSFVALIKTSYSVFNLLQQTK
ncbi:uncharacterized protein LOC122574374 [Bombus pyrosoma]|uniref:uncharacterized protein LOC122574374 n=1 Tax=Bombus pyrosoma TaxID=396416 RepID=UPI001CB95083|nr:uncharacterized protein LOC122574374 [Bombus pyrosoma]